MQKQISRLDINPRFIGPLTAQITLPVDPCLRCKERWEDGKCELRFWVNDEPDRAQSAYGNYQGHVDGFGGNALISVNGEYDVLMGLVNFFVEYVNGFAKKCGGRFNHDVVTTRDGRKVNVWRKVSEGDT